MIKYAENTIFGVCFCDVFGVHWRIVSSASWDKGELIMFLGSEDQRSRSSCGGIQSLMLCIDF